MQQCFYINLPIGGLAALMILAFFTNQSPASRPSWGRIILALDFPGLALVIGSLVCYILAMQWGGVDKAWGSAEGHSLQLSPQPHCF